MSGITIQIDRGQGLRTAAAQPREQAEQESDAKSREALLELATTYEKLADAEPVIEVYKCASLTTLLFK